jgi:hypothetical protein
MIVDPSTWSKLREDISRIDFGEGKKLPVVGYLHLMSMKLHAARHADRENPFKDLLDIASISKHQNLTFKDIEESGILEKYGTKDTITRLRELLKQTTS